jgi:hypothetical protein
MKELILQFVPYIAAGLMSNQFLEYLKIVFPWLSSKQSRLLASFLIPITLGIAASYFFGAEAGEAFALALISFTVSYMGYPFKKIGKTSLPKIAESPEVKEDDLADNITGMMLSISNLSTLDSVSDIYHTRFIDLLGEAKNNLHDALQIANKARDSADAQK